MFIKNSVAAAGLFWHVIIFAATVALIRNVMSVRVNELMSNSPEYPPRRMFRNLRSANGFDDYVTFTCIHNSIIIFLGKLTKTNDTNICNVRQITEYSPKHENIWWKFYFIYIKSILGSVSSTDSYAMLAIRQNND